MNSGRPIQYPPHVLRYLSRIHGEEKQTYSFRAAHDDPQRWQEEARRQLFLLLGLDRIRSELKGYQADIEWIGVEDKGYYIRKRGVIHTEPDVALPFWVLKPKSDKRFPMALLPHGHTHWGADQYVGLYKDEAGRQKIQRKHKDLAVQAVKHGFLAIAPVTRGFEPLGMPDIDGRLGDKSCRAQTVHCLSAGRTALGERLWDLRQLLDLALNWPDVDSSRVLVAGHSGGGVLSGFLSGIDTRVTHAVVNESFAPFYLKDGQFSLCECNVIPGLSEWGEYWDVLGLSAPRSMMVVCGKNGLYPFDEVRNAVERVGEVYKGYGAEEQLVFYAGNEGCLIYENAIWSHVSKVLLTNENIGLLDESTPTARDSDTAARSLKECLHNIGSVSVRKVTRDNVLALCKLSTRPDQSRFCKANSTSIAQAGLEKNSWMRAIYLDETPIGFILIIPDQAGHAKHYLWRFMVDEQYQGKGLGQRALETAIAAIREEMETKEIYLRYVSEPGNARKFFKRCGFDDTGAIIGRDGVMSRYFA